jgi:hypothetical protein
MRGALRIRPRPRRLDGAPSYTAPRSAGRWRPGPALGSAFSGVHSHLSASSCGHIACSCSFFAHFCSRDSAPRHPVNRRLARPPQESGAPAPARGRPVRLSPSPPDCCIFAPFATTPPSIVRSGRRAAGASGERHQAPAPAPTRRPRHHGRAQTRPRGARQSRVARMAPLRPSRSWAAAAHLIAQAAVRLRRRRRRCWSAGRRRLRRPACAGTGRRRRWRRNRR